MISEKELKRYSKFMSLVLRHRPEQIGLRLDENGWADVNELIEKMNMYDCQLDQSIVEYLVATNNKQRFAFNADKSRIRANQGHSLSVDLKLVSLQPPNVLYHGTAAVNLTSILASGLEKRDRQHVHLSSEVETARTVGQRHGKPIVLHIDAAKMFNDGWVFYKSENGVWLTDAVPAFYIRTI